MIKESIEIVIPAYNEEKNISVVVKKGLGWLKTQTKDYLITVVDDGSTDNTGKILDTLDKENKNLKVIHHKKNLGIGESWFSLYKQCSKDIIFTCPADQQFDPADFSKTLDYLNYADIISIYRPRKTDYSIFRIILTNFHRLIIKILFNLNMKDINWVKMYKKWVLKELNLKSRSVLLETEILAKAKKRNARIIQIKAPYYPRIHGKPKGAKLKNIYFAFIGLIRLFLSVKIFK